MSLWAHIIKLPVIFVLVYRFLISSSPIPHTLIPLCLKSSTGTILFFTLFGLSGLVG